MSTNSTFTPIAQASHISINDGRIILLRDKNDGQIITLSESVVSPDFPEVKFDDLPDWTKVDFLAFNDLEEAPNEEKKLLSEIPEAPRPIRIFRYKGTAIFLAIVAGVVFMGVLDHIIGEMQKYFQPRAPRNYSRPSP